jgi:protein-S-isoprenylcysteine O-methyltransferase Ste14
MSAGSGRSRSLSTLFAFDVEEPTLRRVFGREYDDYCRRVHRWRPRF